MEYFAHSQKEFVYKYVVMLSDTDQFEHTSFANYLKLMFLAADALFVSCYDTKFLAVHRLKLVNSRLQFKKQTIAGNHILIKVNSAQIDGSTFSLIFTFVIEGSGELVGLGRQTYIMLSRESNQPEYLSEAMKKLLGPIRVEEENLLYKY